ncbi:hypothetical protein GCM10009785_11840 [Brooklawnia cerclae]|uniref:Uncharacterized protein n=1 Tax=Brooklawnia cerclae TaxID=349934 RepID=A0ABX0SKX1_9ACTN|nr:hypothetical protein [Brooklawnia cerclae]NIH58589.1 hypothetical protein [Brooklawnia cerclae]
MTTTASTGYVAYEYVDVQVDRELEPLYRDAYHNFGWVFEGYGAQPPLASRVVLRLRRDRRIANRGELMEQQRACEHALSNIATLEQSKAAIPMAVALGLGIIGSAFLAGAVFAISAGAWGLGVPLGLVGLAGWAAGFLAHGRVKADKTAQVAPQIDREYEAVYVTGERAARLLAV